MYSPLTRFPIPMTCSDGEFQSWVGGGYGNLASGSYAAVFGGKHLTASSATYEARSTANRAARRLVLTGGRRGSRTVLREWLAIPRAYALVIGVW